MLVPTYVYTVSDILHAYIIENTIDVFALWLFGGYTDIRRVLLFVINV